MSKYGIFSQCGWIWPQKAPGMCGLEIFQQTDRQTAKRRPRSSDLRALKTCLIQQTSYCLIHCCHTRSSLYISIILKWEFYSYSTLQWFYCEESYLPQVTQSNNEMYSFLAQSTLWIGVGKPSKKLQILWHCSEGRGGLNNHTLLNQNLVGHSFIGRGWFIRNAQTTYSSIYIKRSICPFVRPKHNKC